MRHQNDACPSPSAAAAAVVGTTTTASRRRRRLRSKSNLEIENQTRQTIADQHRLCRQKQLAANSNKPSVEHYHRHNHTRQQQQSFVEANSHHQHLLLSSLSAALLPASLSSASSSQQIVETKEVASCTDKNMTIVQAGAEANKVNVVVAVELKCEKLDHDRCDQKISPELDKQQASRKRKRARTCSTSSKESIQIDDTLQSTFTTKIKLEATQKESAMMSIKSVDIKVEPMTPIHSPEPIQTLDAGELLDTNLPTTTAVTTPTADSPESTTTTTTVTTPNLHPTNHQRQNSSPMNGMREGEESISRAARDHFRQQDLPEKITDAQLDRLNMLIKIIRQGSYNEFIELLAERTFKNLLNVFVDGHTALHYSLIYGRSLAWCKQLVSNGANPNLTNRSGWHPIHLAAFNGSRETMRYLIDCIAN